MGKNKRRRKAALSLAQIAKEHIQKIQTLESKNNPVREFWEAEAKNYATQSRRRQKQLPQSRQKAKREKYAQEGKLGKKKS